MMTAGIVKKDSEEKTKRRREVELKWGRKLVVCW